MACRQHVSRSIGQEGRGQRGSGFRQTGAQGILQVVDNQVRVFGSRAPMAEIGGWRTVSSVQRLSAGTFRAPVWRNCRHCRRRRNCRHCRRRRNCRHCRRRRSRRRQALPLMSRSLRSFESRLLNRNAPDVPWDGTQKMGELLPMSPKWDTGSNCYVRCSALRASAMLASAARASDAPRGLRRSL